MAEDAKEATGSMGDDTPLAVLSDKYRPLYHSLDKILAKLQILQLTH